MRLFPFLLIGVVFLIAGGCEQRIKYRYFPTAPETLVVHDTVTVHPPCKDDDGWH